MQRIALRLGGCAALCLAAGCTFNFEVTSQRTALENQVMGTYKELDDDLVLVSAVRAGGQAALPEVSPSKRRALDARLNQQFNRDDLDELKDKGVLGEANDGAVALLPSNLGATKAVAAGDLKLAQALVAEENRDREALWRRTIETNENLSAKDLPEIRSTYAKVQRDNAAPGQWVQDERGAWQRKGGA
jgi:hypothetical protein